AHPLRFAGIHPRRRQLPFLRLDAGARRTPALLHRRPLRRLPADHRQTPSEHPPPARRRGIPHWSLLLARQGNSMSRIAVLGSGAWGTAIALALHRRGGHQITLWSYSAAEAGLIAAAGENTLFLPGFPIPKD